MCLQRSIASVVALAIQKRHFVDHLLVWRQVDGRSGVFCCSVRILLLIILPLHRYDDNKIFLLTASFFYFACHGSSCKWTQMTNKKVAHFVPLPCFHWHISCRFRTFGDITETPGPAWAITESDSSFPLCSLNGKIRHEALRFYRNQSQKCAPCATNR